MSKGPKAPRPASYQFHPHEMSFLGYSGTGKTTLIESLLRYWKGRWSLGYIKHDAHAFHVDYQGKDTARAREAGAQSAFIGNDSGWAWMATGKVDLFTQKSMFLDYDALLVEGYKNLEMDKIVVLDHEGAILEALSPEAKARIEAYVGSTEEPPSFAPTDKPYFSRDAVTAIAAFLESRWNSQRSKRPLHGLVLAGGFSQRMGQDKGLIHYRGQPQALTALSLLEERGIPSFLSLREEQWSEGERSGHRIINDQFLGLGPLGGLLSAMQQYPDAAWLVLACDLPLLEGSVLDHLLKERQGWKMATAYRSSSDGLPEPLCAIYEPKIRMRLYQALGLGLSCPRKVLLSSPIAILEPGNPEALTNVNTPEDYREVRRRLQQHEHQECHSPLFREPRL